MALFAAPLAAAFPAAAQTYTVLHAFAVAQDEPAGLIQASDGNFYGTTSEGGANRLGSVFVVTPAGALTTIYTFSGCDGAYPYAGLVQGTDGNFYGTTYQGGATGDGTVFRITTAGALTTLYSFAGNDGKYPKAALVQGTDRNFYGTTYQGGPSDMGTVFRITPAGVLTTLYSFASSTYPGTSFPQAALVQGADGSFYGTTFNDRRYGTVFKITPGGALTILHAFTGSDGAYPASLMKGTDGNLYGTTLVGGTGSNGTVFKVTPAGVLTTLYSFSGGLGVFPDGASPWGGLVQGTDGDLYGTAFLGGASGNGTVFKITLAGVLTTLYSFSWSEGANPSVSLVQGTDGSFYGKTLNGGTSGKGMIFKVTPAGGLTPLYSFSYGTDGASPYAGLVQGTDGDFFGTASAGGTFNSGVVFKITPAGALTTLYEFSYGSGGANPFAGLVQGSDGNFYGTTVAGGTNNEGTVFKITPAGALTTLYSFVGSDGRFPQEALVQGTDGNFYGTTPSGGTSGSGTIFKITPTGTLTTLYSFVGSDGATPQGGLVQGTDGNFYGTTNQGGTIGFGTVFKITPAGTLTSLHSFAGTEGRYPRAGIVQGADGIFYGTTAAGGTGNHGTVFKITPAGVLTTIYSFTGSSGGLVYGGLVQGTDGNFYGTTWNGGTSANYGTVFRITPTGVLTTLHVYTYSSDGALPTAGLAQGTDGDFYGTASSGGSLGGGVVFRMTSGPGPSPAVTGVSPSGGPVSGGTVVTISGTDFQPGGTVDFGGTAAAGVTYVSATTIYALTPVHAAGAVTVTVTNPDLQAGSLASAFTYVCSWVPTALNGGPYCAGGTISLWAPTISGAAYFWTGPNGFTSAVQNPTILGATAVNAGTYSVTVTVAACASAPGTTAVVVNPVPAMPAVTAPSAVGAGSPNRTAGVPPHAGSTYSWTIGNGTITSGQGTSEITFTAGTAGTPLTLSVTETNASGCASAPGNATVMVAPAGSAVLFYTLPPCRVLDTRNPTGPLGGPSLQPGATRTFDVAASICGIPATAKAISVNLAVTGPVGPGHLTLYPGDAVQAPSTSTINFSANQTRANNAVLPLASDGSGTINVLAGTGGTVAFILDVNGYFE
jgi:uncharacterized repeat protein (TIGR03803 family)